VNRQSAPFRTRDEAPKEDLGDGIVRQILGYDDSILMARVWFEKGAVGQIHAHPHSQVTYIESGAFEFTVGDEVRRLEQGDCVYAAPDTRHGAVCIEKGVLIDVFSPIRDDFLSGEQDI